ncbi:MAG TPA: SRPBCC family protein [Rhizomicrobium sp.]
MMNISPATLDARAYGDPLVYARERHAIFGRNWLLFAHESNFAQSGAYVAATIAGFPLIAVKGEDGTIRAFHNLCRHRAGPLAPDGEGVCAGALTCRYHGWRYGLDGRLQVARDFGPATDFDVRQYGLVQVRCESWWGFVFINLDADAVPLHEAVAPLDARAKDLPLETFRYVSRSTHTIRCNWKTYAENYLEGYHIPIVHPALDAAIVSPKYENEIAWPIVFSHAPARDGAAVSGLWAWMWPCLGVNIYAQGLMMERIWPLDHATTQLDYLYFFPEGLAQSEITRAMQSSEVTTAEDIAITEAVQRNLDAGIYKAGRLSPRHETAIHAFQNAVAASGAIGQNAPA